MKPVVFDMDLMDEDIFNEYLRVAIQKRWSIRPGDAKVIKVPPGTYQIRAAILTDSLEALQPVQPEWLNRSGAYAWIARSLGKLLKEPSWGKWAKYPPVTFDDEIIPLMLCQIGMWEIKVGYGPESNVLALGERRLIGSSAPPKKLTVEDAERMLDELAAALVPDDANGE